MKTTYSKNLMIIAILFLSAITACKKDDSNNPSSSSSQISGTWKVSYYYDKVKDETSDFNGYAFEFAQNGELNITGNSGNVTGTWSQTSSDDNGGSQKLNIFAGTTDPLNNLNDDWIITSSSSTKIELKDDSNNNEVLHFTKI